MGNTTCGTRGSRDGRPTGKNPVHVKEAVGHADLRMTMAYTHLVRENLRGLVDEPDREVVRDLA